MNSGRCQICGRRKGLTVRGLIGHHHTAGERCLGIGHPPLEQSDARLVEIHDTVTAQREAVLREIRDRIARRANWIDPALYLREASLFRLQDRLARRIRRHQNWPRRFAREMELRGWGSPPPAYLIARSEQHEGLY